MQIRGVKGERSVPIAEFYKLPGMTPHIETVLEPGDLITAVRCRRRWRVRRSGYLKLRDRAAYEFALASAAIVLSVSGGKCDACARGAGWCGDDSVEGS